jgi:polyphosphate kinase
MPRAKKSTTDNSPTPPELDLSNPEYYFNRELSWLEFNQRVIQEALDERTPLLERLKFTAIFSNNLDEFFMVRVSGLKEQVAAGMNRRTPDGLTPQEQLHAISEKLRPTVAKQHENFEHILRHQLTEQGVYLLNYVDLNQEQRQYLKTFYQQQIFPVLTPLAVDPGHPFPHISNLSLSLAVVIRDTKTKVEHFARVKVPQVLPRFVELPKHLRVHHDGQPAIWTGVPLEQIIAHNLESLFSGMTILEYHPFRITRDADFDLAEDEADDLLLAIEQNVRQRRLGGSVVRMEINSSMPANIRDTLMREMGLADTDIYEIEGLLNLGNLMSLMGLPLPDLKDPSWTPITPAPFRRLSDISQESDFEGDEDIFALIRQHDLLVHHPYHSFSATVERFITQAAHDPDVLAIKMTLYRTSGDSPMIQALIDATENRKQVAVLVELKARFDEENNITWARKLEKAGVHVVYGLVGLKTHTKTLLVVRREQEQIRRYVHIGTGNYNPKTARLYTDLGLFSCREQLGADLTDLFNYLTGYSRQDRYQKLLVAPVTLRDRMLALIQREIDHCKQEGQGRIVAKMNALVDAKIIAKLYEASQSGVKIDLIIRGICCLRPGIEGISDNIRVISIIGRFLEHSRIFYFHNNGQDEIYIGSADWMPRNLDRRVEAVVPIEDEAIAKDLQEILGIMLADNRQAWELQSDGTYIQRHPEADNPPQSTHAILMEMAKKQSGS